MELDPAVLQYDALAVVGCLCVMYGTSNRSISHADNEGDECILALENFGFIVHST